MVFRPASPVMAWQLMFPVEATSMPMKTSTLTRSALQMDTSRWLIFKIENNINTCLSIWTHQHVVTRSSRDEYSIIIQSFISNQLINKIIRSLSSMDQKILMILPRGQNIDRRYILKAILVLFSQYRKISISSPTNHHIDYIFFVFVIFCLFYQKSNFKAQNTHF